MTKYMETTANLNIREKGEVIETIPKNTLLIVSDTVWYEVELEGGGMGLASGKYLQAYSGEVEAPIVTLPAGKATGKAIVTKAMTQSGDPYIFGTEVDLGDSDPDAFDCSELVQWVCAQLDVKPTMPDGAIYQMQHCQKNDTMISISQAVKTVGALLFRIPGNGQNHVVISRGDGSTIEAKGSAYGVGVFSTANRGWTHAGLIPGVSYA